MTSAPDRSPASRPPVAFEFRPWVRSTCRRAMLWGLGVLAVLVGVVWLLRDPSEGVFGKAFTVLLGYGVLFWASLLKIWWTAGRPAVLVEDRGLAYQPLHAFRPRRVAFDRVLFCGPRPGSQSLRLVVEKGQRGRELFLNLAVVRSGHELLDVLGERLEAAGLVPEGKSWVRPHALTSDSRIR